MTYNRVFGGILKNLPVQTIFRFLFVPGDFLRFRLKCDYKSRSTNFKFLVFFGVSIKLETVISALRGILKLCGCLQSGPHTEHYCTLHCTHYSVLECTQHSVHSKSCALECTQPLSRRGLSKRLQMYVCLLLEDLVQSCVRERGEVRDMC